MTGRQAAALALVFLGVGRAALAQPPPEALPRPATPVPGPGPDAVPGPGPDAVPGPDSTPPSLPTPDQPTDGAIEKSTLGAPSAQWTTWQVQGRLLEDLDTIAGFLEPVMMEHKTWSDADQQEVAE